MLAGFVRLTRHQRRNFLLAISFFNAICDSLQPQIRRGLAHGA